MERHDQNIHAALVGGGLSNIDHPDSSAGMAVIAKSRFDSPGIRRFPTCSVVSDRNP